VALITAVVRFMDSLSPGELAHGQNVAIFGSYLVGSQFSAGGCNASTSWLAQANRLEWSMPKLTRQLPADSCEVALDLPRASESCLNVRQNILSPNVFEKI
jgi:hypothetical protein